MGGSIAHAVGVPRPAEPPPPPPPPDQPPFLQQIPYQGPNAPNTIYAGPPPEPPPITDPSQLLGPQQRQITYQDRANPPPVINAGPPSDGGPPIITPPPTDADLGRTQDLSLNLQPGTTEAKPDIAFGDSLAVGMQRNAGIDGTEAPFRGGQNQPGTARVGAPPSEVLQRINDASDDQIAGKDVLLSTGVSNDPGAIEAVAQQIATLYQRGAANVRVMGVGTRPDLAPLNDKLAEIAEANNAQFLGPLKHVGNDQVHSTDYTAELQGTRSPLDTGTPPQSSSVELLAPYAKDNAQVGGASGIEKVDPYFAQRIADAVAQMPPDIAAKFRITSAFRDQDRENAVYAKQWPGQPVPQNSHHGMGLAVDVERDPDVQAWINAHPETGIGFPIRHLAGEDNHLEPIDANGNRIWGTPGSVDAGSTPTPREAMPGERFGQAVDFFVDKGLTRDQAIGIVSRLHAESGLDANNTNSIGATGIAQWYDRRPAMEASGAKGDFQKQLDYIWHEFQTSEAPAFEKIRNAKTAADAARAMEDYERAGNPAFTESAAALAARISGGDVGYPAAGHGAVVPRGGARGGGEAGLGGTPSAPLIDETSRGEPRGLRGEAAAATAETAAPAAADTQLARAIDAVGALQAGSPVTNKRLQELAGSGTRAEQTVVRNALVQRGLITQRNGRYIRADTINQPSALAPTESQATRLPQEPRFQPPAPPAELTQPRPTPAPVAEPAPPPPPAVPPVPPGGVPFMMTNAMRQQLAARGHTPDQIRNMTPTEAHGILSQPAAEPAPAEPRPQQPPPEARPEPPPVEPPPVEPPPADHPELSDERSRLPEGYGIAHDPVENTYHLYDPRGQELEALSEPGGMADVAQVHAAAMGGEGGRFQRPGIEEPVRDAAGFTPEHIALRNHLYRLAKEMAPSLRFETFRRLFDYSTGKKLPIHGRYDPPGNGLLEHVVKVALSGPDPIGALHHEIVHFFRNSGMFTKAEWGILSKQADKWRDRFNIDERYPGETLGVKREEAIAEAASAWHRGELQAPPGIRRIFQRVADYFHRVANYLRGRGFQNADDIFRKMRSGEIGAREPGVTYDETGARNKVAGRDEADLDRALPVKDRRVGEYIPGHGTIATDHKPWMDRDLSQPGRGANFTQQDIDETFQNALRSVVRNARPEERAAMQQRIDQFLKDHPTFGPKSHGFWDTALKLPDRARFWYEVSAEAFKHAGRGINNPAQRLKQFFDVVAATSAQADPNDNLRRAIALMAEERQGVPIQTDITSPSAVRKGLAEGDLTGNKTGAFSRTFSHILGFDPKTPLSVNDRQVASSFGITGDDIMSHQWLHEAISKFYQDIRDKQNEGVRPGENPYETWQLQALGWVHERALKDAAKGSVENYDDYAAVMKRLDARLTAAGVDTSGGLLSDKVLMDPRTPNILSGTREQYVGARNATLETATTQTGEGQTAHRLNQRLSAIDEPWARKAQGGYEAIQRRVMAAIGGRFKGNPSAVEDLMSAIAGRKVGVTRIDTNGYGTFEGTVSPNMRIPLVGRTTGGGFFNLESPESEPARHALLAALGKYLHQDASAASKFGALEPGDPNTKTYSIFLPGTKEGEHIGKIGALERDLGYPLNVHEVPNGTVIDINVGGFDRLPTQEEVLQAADRHFPDVDAQIAARSYDSDYLTRDEYDGAIDRFWGGERAGANDQSEGVGRARPATPDRGLWERATQALQSAAERRDRDFQQWHDQYAQRADVAEQRARERGAADDVAAGTHTAGVDDGARFQRPRNVASEDERADLSRVQERDDRSLWQRSRDWVKGVRDDNDVWTRIKQNFLDSTAGLNAFERSVNNGALLDAAVSPTKMAHLTANPTTVMSTIIGRQHGGEWTGGALRYNAKEGAFENIPGSKSLGEIFKPIFDAGLQDKWALWAIANRAKRLMAEGRENNVPQDIIDKYQNLDRQHPEFRQAMADWRQLNKHTLDMAEQTGLVSAESRKLFENEDYVPFYRAFEDRVGGPNSGGGMIANVRSGIKTLTGGEAKVNDIYENMVRNLSSLVDRSMRNEAMNRLVKIGAGTDAMTPMSVDAREAINTPEMRSRLQDMGLDPDKMTAQAKEAARDLFGALQSKDPSVVSVMTNGKPQFYRVNNKPLLRSIAAMGPRETEGIVKILGAPKRILTTGVTLDPAFMLRNVLRDSLHAWVVTGHGFKPGWDTAKGFVDALRNSPSAMAIMAGGAGGAHFYDTSPAGVRRMLQSQGFKDSVLDTPRKILHFVERAGAASEMANRIAIYDNAIKSGASKAEAIWRAQDMMNFTMSGDNKAMQFLIQTVPFLNARMQGLARLGRGAYENPKSFFLRGSLIMAAAAALWLKNKDDPRYKALEDWDRQNYFHFFVGDQHFRLPQPFEVGALFSSVPEMLLNYWNNGRSRELGTAAASLLSNQLQGNLVPQALRPALDVYANKNSLSGAPIVTPGEEKLAPGLRYGPHTSPLMVGIGQTLGYSPDQLEYLLRGYTGTLGTYGLSAADALARATGAAPSAPTMRADQMPLISSFVRNEPAMSSRWMTEFYDLKSSVDQTVASVNALRKAGRVQEAADLQRANPDLMSLQKPVLSTTEQLAKIRQQMIRVQSSNVSPADKRLQLDNLIAQRNRVAEEVRPMIQRREHLSAAP